MFATLLVLGALDGLTDVAMNTQAVELQRRVGTSIITRFHAVWSAGAVTGGIVASRAAAAGISLRAQLLVTGGVLVVRDARRVAVAAARPPRARVEHRRRRRCATAARPVLVLLFLVGVAIALAELPPNDWSALLMTDRFDLDAGAAGLGLRRRRRRHAGRPGRRRPRDRPLRARAHPPRRRRARRRRRRRSRDAGAVAVGAGAGLFVTGLGLSSLFPLLFRAASDLTHGSHSGMASFSSGARLGFLLASPLMGIIAERTSVATAMLVVAGAARGHRRRRLPRGAVAGARSPDPL